MSKLIKLEAELVQSGWLDGTDVKVRVDLDEVFAVIDTDDIIDELNERADNADVKAKALLSPPDEPFWRDDSEDGPFASLTPYEVDELRRAVALDDGARALELLRRAPA